MKRVVSTLYLTFLVKCANIEVEARFLMASGILKIYFKTKKGGYYMKIHIIEVQPDFDQEMLRRYCENVQAILDVVEAHTEEGMQYNSRLIDSIMENVVFDTNEPETTRIEFLKHSERICGFEVYGLDSERSQEPVRKCLAFLLPYGNDKLITYAVNRYLEPRERLLIKDDEDVERSHGVMCEILQPTIEWMGGICDFDWFDSKTDEKQTFQHVGDNAMEVNVWLKGYGWTSDISEGRKHLRSFSGEDVPALSSVVQHKLKQNGLPERKSERGKFWAKFFETDECLQTNTRLQTLGVRASLRFVGDKIHVYRTNGFFDDYGCVSASMSGLEQIQAFVRVLEKAVE